MQSGPQSSLPAFTGPRRRPALAAGVAATIGSALAWNLAPGDPWPWMALGAAAILVTLAAVLRRRRIGWLLAWLGVGLMLFGYAALRARPAQDSLASRFPHGAELVRLRGVIIEGGDYLRRDPAAFEYPEQPEPIKDFPIATDPRRNVSYLLEVHELPDLGERASGLVKLYLPPHTRLEVLSEVSVLGRLRQPRRAGNPGEVDSANLYRARGITHSMNLTDAAQVTLIGAPGALDPRQLPARVHEYFHSEIGARMPEGQAGVLGAALLGERGTLSPEQRKLFAQSGTIHLLVVSGLHVALLAGAVVTALRLFGLKLRWCWALAAPVALAYLAITGVQPSTLRATIMVLVYALGMFMARRPDSLNVLGASALIALLIDPAQVVDVGFALSYLAVLGIVVVAPALQVAARREREGPVRVTARWLGNALRISLAVGLATWPLLAFSLHLISPVMLASNLLAGPLVSLVLLLSPLALLAPVPGVGVAVAWLFSLLAGLLQWLSALFAAAPYGHLYVAAPPVWWVGGYYALLVAALALPRLGLPRIAGACAWAAWLCVLPALAFAHNEPPGPLRLTALDIGQGVCAVAEVPGGPTLVVDCGSTSLGSPGERVLAPYLWSRGRSRIDYLALSHADADHVNGLPQLFERFAVGRVLVGEGLDSDESGRALHDWLSARTQVVVFRRGDEIEIAPRVTLRCLWPDTAYVEAMISAGDRRNDAGMVLELEAGERRVLLPGDVEHRGLAPLMARYRGRGVDLLFAPHQGSAITGLEDMLAALRPQHTIISARETFPDEAALDTYTRTGALWRTYGQGAVTFLVGADGSIDVRPFLK